MSKRKPAVASSFLNPEWLDYADRFRRKVLPKISSSAHMVVIAPDVPDVQMMLQIGAAICLDKPIVLFVPPGRPVLPRLWRVADKIIECDMSTEVGQEAAKAQLLEFIRQ